MFNIVIRTSKLDNLLTANRQSYFSTLEARVFVNDLAVDPNAGNGQFTECTDSGYALQPVTFGAPYNADQDGAMDMDTIFYTMDHDAGDFDAYGVYLTDPNDGDEWVLAARFADKVPITAPGQILRVDGTYRNRRLPLA